MNGSGGGCAPSPGSNGSADGARFAELRRRGVGRDLATQTAGSPHGSWRLANSPALNIALPTRSLGSLGLAPSRCRGLLNLPNRRIRTRTSGGVGGEESRDSPYPDHRASIGLQVQAAAFFSELQIN